MLKPLFSFDYWDLPIYLILLATGAVTSYILINVKMYQVRTTPKTRYCVLGALLLAAIIGVLGSNIMNWVTTPRLWNHLIIDKLTRGGLSFYYGMLTFFGALLLLLRLFKQNHRFWVNETVPYIILFNIIARVGCLLAGCCYGIHIHEFSIFGLTVDVFPVRTIEIVCMTILFILFKKKVIQNRLFWYLASYAIIRFILEFLRGDNQNNWLTSAQITSILILIGLGLYILIRYLKQNPLLKPIEDYEPDIDERSNLTNKRDMQKVLVVIIPCIAVICSVIFYIVFTVKLFNTCTETIDSCVSCSDSTTELFDSCNNCLDISDSLDSCEYETSTTMTDKPSDYLYEINEEIKVLDVESKGEIGSLKITDVIVLIGEPFEILKLIERDENGNPIYENVKYEQLIQINYISSVVDSTKSISKSNFSILDCNNVSATFDPEVEYKIENTSDKKIFIALENKSDFIIIDFKFYKLQSGATAKIKANLNI